VADTSARHAADNVACAAAHTAATTTTNPAAQGGCGHCHNADVEPVCAVPVRPGSRAQLSGAADELARVEQALQQCPELGGLGLSSGVIRSIHAEGGEVELLLNVGSCGGGARLVHAVFDHLRQVLLNTDIYVRPAG
jgi:hypothetical protein